MSEKKIETESTKIRKLFVDVELYRQAIQDAKDALAAAEEELDEALADAWEEEQKEQR